MEYYVKTKGGDTVYKYEVSFTWGLADKEFTSKYLVARMKVTRIGPVSLVNFEDAKISIDLARVKEMKINGKKYTLKTYEDQLFKKIKYK